MSNQENNNKNLETVIHQIEKQFGKGSIMRLGSKEVLKVEYISTGALNLDMALGIGGIPRGRIIEIYGPESSGKTTLSLEIAANAQRAGFIVSFIDAEHALDPKYAKNIGVNTDNLYISQPDFGEQALEILETLVRSSAIQLIIIDSVAALVPKSEIEGNMGDAHMGAQARLMSQALRKLTGIISRSNCSVIFINQLRSKIGTSFGNPEVTTGGNALKFYASVRMEIRRVESIKKNEEIIGNHVRVKVVKNKLAPPFKMAEFDIIFSKGISKTMCLIDIASSVGIIKKSGTWFSYKSQQLGQGKENTKIFLDENPSLSKEIYYAVLKHFNIEEDLSKSKNTATDIEENAMKLKNSESKDKEKKSEKAKSEKNTPESESISPIKNLKEK